MGYYISKICWFKMRIQIKFFLYQKQATGTAWTNPNLVRLLKKICWIFFFFLVIICLAFWRPLGTRSGTQSRFFIRFRIINICLRLSASLKQNFYISLGTAGSWWCPGEGPDSCSQRGSGHCGGNPWQTRGSYLNRTAESQVGTVL